MPMPLLVRPLLLSDAAAWMPLWQGYNAFYGRAGATALPEEITRSTWQRFFDAYEPVHALVAQQGERLVGLTHYLFHRSTTQLGPTCYLQDLFTAPARRGQGIGRALIDDVYDAARAAGIHRVYWQTHESNAVGRALYDKMARHHGFIVYAKDV